MLAIKSFQKIKIGAHIELSGKRINLKYRRKNKALDETNEKNWKPSLLATTNQKIFPQFSSQALNSLCLESSPSLQWFCINHCFQLQNFIYVFDPFGWECMNSYIGFYWHWYWKIDIRYKLWDSLYFGIFENKLCLQI